MKPTVEDFFKKHYEEIFKNKKDMKNNLQNMCKLKRNNEHLQPFIRLIRRNKIKAIVDIINYTTHKY